MSRKYKFNHPEGIYFVSFATVYWVDVFVREKYFAAFAESLSYCRQSKGLELFAYCIMPSHIHLVFRDKNSNPSKLIKELKTYTSKRLQKLVAVHDQESRKNWLLWIFRQVGKKNSNITHSQFWQQHNQPIELWSNHVIEQKIDYIHNNPVESGFVTEAHLWKYSSARNYANEIGVIEIDKIE